MKLLVFSDSHGKIVPMTEAIRREKPDAVLHLGDCAADLDALKQQCPVRQMLHVVGNCDRISEGPEMLCREFDGVRVMMMHGHRYMVKMTYLRAIYAAREQTADLLLFGHTHRQECFCEGDLWVFNPGAAGTGCYGVVEISQGTVSCELKKV